MTDSQLLEYSRKIRFEAESILYTLRDLGIGTDSDCFEVIGSYAYNLMYDRDLDMIMKTKDPANTARNLCHKLIDCMQFSRIEFGDFWNYQKNDRPKGFIICLFIQTQSYPLWEAELWIVDTSHKDSFNASKELADLSDEKKIAILRDKHHRSIKRISKKDLPSVQIYAQYI